MIQHWLIMAMRFTRSTTALDMENHHLDDLCTEADLARRCVARFLVRTLDRRHRAHYRRLNGGYMVAAALAFVEAFEVGINIFGVTNWLRTESIPLGGVRSGSPMLNWVTSGPIPINS